MPPETMLTMRRDLQASLLGAAGVPVEIVTTDRASSDAREGWRRFIFSTIRPVGQVVAAEAQRVLGGSGRIDWSDLAASDLQARARAYAGLVGAGMDAATARRICGFD